jgi:hypothetical protein
LDLGCQVCEIVAKKNFWTHQGRDQENLLVKQRRERNIVHDPNMGADTSDNRCKGEKVGW